MEIVRCAIGAKRIAKALEINLKMTLISAIGRKSLIESAPGTFGRSERTPKFRREISTLPNVKSFKIPKIKGRTRFQKDLKKATGKPSGPGAVSVLV
jgi:hypothetical protein